MKQMLAEVRPRVSFRRWGTNSNGRLGVGRDTIQTYFSLYPTFGLPPPVAVSVSDS